MRWFFLVMALVASLAYAWYAYTDIASGALGLELREILVSGQKRTSKKSLLWAIHMTKGHHMWKQPLESMHTRIESLPWVKSASIQRKLPWTLIVTLVEKNPIAIWQNKGKKCIIDEEGNAIIGALPKKFPELVVIVGPQAPKHVSKLLEQLAAIRTLPPVKAACFLRSQRWDLYLEGGKMIQLPQEHRGKALRKLLNFWPMIKDSPKIDLRFPDALIFSPCP